MPMDSIRDLYAGLGEATIRSWVGDRRTNRIAIGQPQPCCIETASPV